MKVREIMTKNVVRIHPDEPVEVAARALTHYNVGAMPVCGSDGRICGVITDRDLVTRCVASGRNVGTTTVRDVMTGRVIAAGPEMDVTAAAHLMGREQVRRLPVVENGKLCGMICLGDLAGSGENVMEAADALAEITANVCQK
ncbi:MAG: CBS domain-containing protein [Ruminococcaceae bacterium]|nr:CBS domain-containing protein [Oscillospiraceae bacterium]